MFFRHLQPIARSWFNEEQEYDVLLCLFQRCCPIPTHPAIVEFVQKENLKAPAWESVTESQKEGFFSWAFFSSAFCTNRSIVPGKVDSTAFSNLSCKFTRSRVPETSSPAFGLLRKSKTFSRFLLQHTKQLSSGVLRSFLLLETRDSK